MQFHLSNQFSSLIQHYLAEKKYFFYVKMTYFCYAGTGGKDRLCFFQESSFCCSHWSQICCAENPSGSLVIPWRKESLSYEGIALSYNERDGSFFSWSHLWPSFEDNKKSKCYFATLLLFVKQYQVIQGQYFMSDKYSMLQWILSKQKKLGKDFIQLLHT